MLTYQWNQTDGPNVLLNDATSVNPTFAAPTTTTQIDLTFQLTVTNEEGTTSKPVM
ncbi:PKD domain-containing protein [Candidatus Nitrosocosmicus sp. R]